VSKYQGLEGPKDDLKVVFSPDDFEILDTVLKEVPELRLCAGILRAAKAAGVKYPIKSVDQLIALLPARQMYVEGHWFRPVLISRYLREEYLPIRSDEELVTCSYLALMRCKEDTRWAAHAPPYAKELLAELPKVTTNKGRD
jgi:hypothetical protein